MGKGSRKGGGGGKSSSDVCWSGADHAIHNEERQRKLEKKKIKQSREGHVSQKERRTRALTHGTGEKREDLRLNLHLTKTKRDLAAMKERLESYDPVEEAEKEKAAAAKRKLDQAQAENTTPKKKKGRKGPETWKLRGAARPAHEVYDFDVRYVDPHAEAHKKAAARAQRSQNLLAIYKGRFGSDTIPSVCRDYLGLLMQVGHLSIEGKQFKSARQAWLECIELEGDDDDSPVTSARESLMRMYLDLKRFDAALRLGGERLAKDTSVWIRYSTALVALSNSSDDGDDDDANKKNRKSAKTPSSPPISPQEHLVNAIRCNPLCAYYLSFYDIFKDFIEYAEEIADADDGPQSSLEEAIEYCSSPQAQQWQGAPAEALRNVLLDARKGTHGQLGPSDAEWEQRLKALEQEFESRKTLSTATANGKSSEEEEEAEMAGGSNDTDSLTPETEDDDHEGSDEAADDEPQPIDLGMYIGMFRTAMEMVGEEGHLK